MFAKILIANRGEIACRVIRTANALGIKTVAVYSDADAQALHVQMADEAVHLGANAPAESYLDGQKIIAAAMLTGAQAVHPGYGFLSENADFAELCASQGVVFIGPPVHAIKVMGSKSAAKQAMQEAQVPLLPGYHENNQDPERLRQAADAVGYPVLLKAVAGGGGKGMRQVHEPSEFDAALASAQREALAGFGSGDMLVEKFLQQPRHVEIQVFCDSHGNGVYLFERDCSVQRRHQKVIEEAPAPNVSAELRARMGDAALKAAQAVSYVGAGTVEFLLDQHNNFYFMEMNTRLQVEHPVTEMITGQDLVAWQLKVAAGQTLPLSQQQLAISGHSFEARIYAEDPFNDFLPTAGKVTWLEQPPATEYVRVDSAVVVRDEVGVFYDPMIAKLIVWGEDRTTALQRLHSALAEYRIAGVTTNIEFLRRLSAHPGFREAQLSTDFIERHAADLLHSDGAEAQTFAVLACLYDILAMRQTGTNCPWQTLDDWRLNATAGRTMRLLIGDAEYDIETIQVAADRFCMTVNQQQYQVVGELFGNALVAVIDGHRQHATVISDAAGWTVFGANQSVRVGRVVPDLGEAVAHDDGTHFKAPMNGTVVEVLVKPGDEVAAGDTLVILEAMKMEHAVKALVDGTVTDVYVDTGELVDGGVELLGFAGQSD